MVNAHQVKRLWRLAGQRCGLELAALRTGMDPNRKNPNVSYSSGVSTVATYARRVVGLAAGRKGNAISQTLLVIANK